MSEPVRTESSVLASLTELQTIERERLAEEAARTARASAEAELQRAQQEARIARERAAAERARADEISRDADEAALRASAIIDATERATRAAQETARALNSSRPAPSSELPLAVLSAQRSCRRAYVACAALLAIACLQSLWMWRQSQTDGTLTRRLATLESEQHRTIDKLREQMIAAWEKAAASPADEHHSAAGTQPAPAPGGNAPAAAGAGSARDGSGAPRNGGSTRGSRDGSSGPGSRPIVVDCPPGSGPLCGIAESSP